MATPAADADDLDYFADTVRETKENLARTAIETAWSIISGSSNVAEMIYWDDAPDGAPSMGIRFHNGREYHYFGVPRSVYASVHAGSGADRSRGKAHWSLVRLTGYGFTRVSDWK